MFDLRNSFLKFELLAHEFDIRASGAHSVGALGTPERKENCH